MSPNPKPRAHECANGHVPIAFDSTKCPICGLVLAQPDLRDKINRIIEKDLLPVTGSPGERLPALAVRDILANALNTPPRPTRFVEVAERLNHAIQLGLKIVEKINELSKGEEA